jgi:hypothetical protein
MSLRSRSVRFGIAAVALGLVAGSAAAVSATVGGGGADRDRGDGHHGVIRERLTGYEETPLALSTSGRGTFRAMVTDTEIKFALSYADTVGTVTQAHIHFGEVGQTGGVSVFLCTNLGNSPVPTQACPAAPGLVTGTLTAADVIGPSGQGIAATEFGELVAAIKSGVAYVNVHSNVYPVGEIRAQIENGHEGH